MRWNKKRDKGGGRDISEEKKSMHNELEKEKCENCLWKRMEAKIYLQLLVLSAYFYGCNFTITIGA